MWLMKLWNYEIMKGSTLSIEDIFFKKTTGGGQIDPPPPAILGLQEFLIFNFNIDFYSIFELAFEFWF